MAGIPAGAVVSVEVVGDPGTEIAIRVAGGSQGSRVTGLCGATCSSPTLIKEGQYLLHEHSRHRRLVVKARVEHISRVDKADRPFLFGQAEKGFTKGVDFPCCARPTPHRLTVPLQVQRRT